MAPTTSDTIDIETENSVEFLREHTRGCTFERADIASFSKRLLAGDAPPPPSPDDAAGLKVEKNALATLFIPNMFALAEELLDTQPGSLFALNGDQLKVVAPDAARFVIDPNNPQGSLCRMVERSMKAVFQHVAPLYIAALRQTAADGDAQAAWAVEALLNRYDAALGNYHGHTKIAEAAFFTPVNHLMAGINTALFFILRALSAITVLGERRLGRPITAEELWAAVGETVPLLLTIARCHLEQLLELEPLMGKGGDLYMTQLDASAYAAALETMFTLAPGPLLRLEFSPQVRAALPRHLTSDKPRTGCPALFAATGDTENAIVTLVRLVGRCYAGLLFSAA
ncbi:MAG TPA: hypothetical protein VK558_18110 [Patescibacteria group bacterium]|nr:hypothetical protein [Patescibacteria group bacterium]